MGSGLLCIWDTMVRWAGMMENLGFVRVEDGDLTQDWEDENERESGKSLACCSMDDIDGGGGGKCRDCGPPGDDGRALTK
jgi:hypothetical protein